MSSTEFLCDSDGMIVQQRYRISSVIDEEVQRRSSYYPGDPNNAASMRAAASSVAASGATAHTAASAAANATTTSKSGFSASQRQLTRLEQRRMDSITERQRANLVQKQVVGGREYKGAGFVADPKGVDFFDFDVGQVYKVRVHLTNVSQTFNAFKVLDVPANVRDLFDVVWTPQSLMSAGMSASIVIVFSPKEEVDIDTQITLLAQTGPVSIPVRCRRKRVVVSVSSNLIDFGAIVVAETVEETLVLRNDGALSTKMEIRGDFLSLLSITQKGTKKEMTPVWSSTPELHVDKPNRMTLAPFSTLSIILRFRPMEVSSFDAPLFISFDNAEVEDKVVFIRGEAIDVPVFVDHNQILDFQCCFYDTLYRDKIVVRNTTSTAVRVQPNVPSALKNVIEFVPKFGFVQPSGARFEFQVKFSPTAEQGSEIDQNIKLTVADQVMPIFFRLKAALTRRELCLHPPELRFGPCVETEALQQTLRISNRSRLPETVGFVKAPPNITVVPANIFTIGPNETVDVHVSVQPPHAGQFSQQLTLKTEHDDLLHVPVSGIGKPATFSLEPPRLLLPKVCVGGSVSATTVLTNTTSEMRKFAFEIDANYGVTVSPASGEIPSNGSVPIVVTFAATRQCVVTEVPPEVPDADSEEAAAAAATDPPRPPSKGTKKKTKAEEEAERKERERVAEERRANLAAARAERERLVQLLAALVPWECSAPGEPWSRHRTLQIPCFVHGWSARATFLEVRCTVVEPVLVARMATSRAAADGAAVAVVAAGEAGLGPTAAAAAAVGNSSAKTSRPSSGQQPLRAPRSRNAAVSESVAAPSAATLADEQDTSQRRRPSEAGSRDLASVPAEEKTSAVAVDFGAVPAQHSVCRTVVVVNTGASPVSLAVAPIDPFGAFAVSRPPAPVLGPGHETELTLSFTPQAKAVYLQKLIVKASSGNDLVVDCIGEGLPAMLAVSLKKEALQAAPTETKELSVAMGPCLVGERAEVPLYFANHSPFPLHVRTAFEARSVVNFNPNATIPFALQPHSFTIPADGKMEVAAIFTPGAEAFYEAQAELAYGGEGSTKRLHFTGNGWSRGMFIEFAALLEQRTRASARRDVLSALGDGVEPLATAANPVVLPFVSREQAPATSAIAIGNVKGSSNGDFAFEGLTDADTKNGWKIDVVKAVVAPGARVVATVTFTPTQLLLDSLPLPNIAIVSLCHVRLVVKGGTPATDQVHHITFKGSAWRTTE